MGLKPPSANGARRRKSIPEGSAPDHADGSSNGQTASNLPLPSTSSNANGRPVAPSPQSFAHPQQPNGPTSSPRQAPPAAYNPPPALSKHNIQGAVTSSSNYRQQPSPALSNRGYAPTPSPQSQSASISINSSIQPQQHQQSQQQQQPHYLFAQQPPTHFSAFSNSPARPPLPPPQINTNMNGPLQQSQASGTRWVPYNPPTPSGGPKPQSHHPKGLQGVMNSDLPISQSIRFE